MHVFLIILGLLALGGLVQNSDKQVKLQKQFMRQQARAAEELLLATATPEFLAERERKRFQRGLTRFLVIILVGAVILGLVGQGG